jgi:hypothetical protein
MQTCPLNAPGNQGSKGSNSCPLGIITTIRYFCSLFDTD